jgi:ABC-2 type transport system ATP-binding protein
MAPIITTHELTKTFGSRELIQNCNITVEQGKIYGFLGANGAGKTTVLKLILGLLKPTVGRIDVLGVDAARSRETILGSIGSMVEVPIFYEHLSAAENLKIFERFYPSSSALAGECRVNDSCRGHDFSGCSMRIWSNDEKGKCY